MTILKREENREHGPNVTPAELEWLRVKGFKEKWLSDNSGWWYEKQFTSVAGVKMAVAVDRFISVELCHPTKGWQTGLDELPYSRRMILQLLRLKKNANNQKVS